jgi:DNA-binding NtrC family response regulator
LRDLPPAVLTLQIRAERPELRVVALIPDSMTELGPLADRAGADLIIASAEHVEEITQAVSALIARDDASRPVSRPERCDTRRMRFFRGYRSLFRRGAAMRKVENAVLCFADAAGPVLVRGERGVGKRAVAQAIHYLSPRCTSPWIEIDCAALPPRLLDGQIFGRGRATGGSETARAAIEEADGGTLLLEEISRLPSETQSTLADFLQRGAVERDGSPIRLDVRVIATTSVDLDQLVAGGAVLESLSRQINQFAVFVPPLRERAEEIAGLANFFRMRFMEEFRRDVPELSEELLDRLRDYHWPGNVAELENLVKRYVVVGDAEQMAEELRNRALLQTRTPRGTESLQAIGQRAALQAEMAVVLETLERVRWNRAEAARQLNVSYKTLLNKLRRAGMTGRGAGRTWPRT